MQDILMCHGIRSLTKKKDIIYQIFNVEVNQEVCVKSLIMHISHRDILLRGYLDIEKVDREY